MIWTDDESFILDIWNKLITNKSTRHQVIKM